MITFDEILPTIQEILDANRADLEVLDWLLINRDLYGRVRLIAPAQKEESNRELLKTLATRFAKALGPHAHPAETAILYEEKMEDALHGAQPFALEGFEKIWIVDRLATESAWERIMEVAEGPRRIVFFSIKGGVGRSTALAACAWALANEGKRLLVMDLDLESPGLSSNLLPAERRPKYGITDWLVEDLVDNGAPLVRDMYATSHLNIPGEIYLVPAHGKVPGEYVSKLGRVWMPKVDKEGRSEGWSARLNRLIDSLTERLRPDVILIDSRAGIDEVATACVTDLGAHTVLLFAIQGEQTWTGYKTLFSHWRQRGVIGNIRERLQLVAGLVPEDESRLDYLAALRADGYQLFAETYDEVMPDEISGWNFEEDDDDAPHNPLPIRWNRGWFGLLSLERRLAQVDDREVQAVYGPLIDFLKKALA